MKAWITKYALTHGVFEREVEERPHGMAVTTQPFFLVFKSGEWHRSLPHAQKKAEAMRVRKIHNLKKQIAKLEGMKFE